MTNAERFAVTLADQYRELFKLPDYALVAKRYTNDELAAKITRGLADGTADKDGEGIKRTCKLLGIPCTYAAISNFLNA